ncbi:NHS-like protein 2 [Salminus brasiliensis]|uniref:NHS-like protein 2 n=1 Tax=Salminus brasiliensis TaxID=930266 RepID=UPI003B837992
MEHTALFCPSQTWTGPNVSTFSSEWDDSVNSYLLAPDVIKPPPQFQDPEEPCQSPPTSSTVIRRKDKERVGTGTSHKERRSRPASAMEPHRRSLSLSTAITSNPAVTRRRCESYALSYPSSSSEDSGSDSTSVRKGDQLPDAVPQSRARSIVLRKAKRKPAPPVRTVSLHRLTDLRPPERRTQSLYIPSDAQNVMLLPDLIPVLKAEADDSEQSTLSAEAPGKVPVSQPLSSHRPLKELRSSEPCKSGSGPSVGTPINEATKVAYNSDLNNSPSSSRSSPSQPSISSPSKPPGSASPSSGYSSQCETPTQSVSVIAGPSSVSCRMRPKPSSAVPGQRVRNSRTRLSLQLPEMQDTKPIPNPEPSPVHPKASRRYSDTSATARPKQRLSNSMLIMPVVTQEDLNNVRLRSVSSFDLDNTAANVSGVIEEENERDGSSLAAQQSPKAKPPVAPKPPVSKRPPTAVAKSSFGTSSGTDPPPPTTSYEQDNIYSTVNKVKSNSDLPPTSNSCTDHGHYQVQQQYDFQSQQRKKEALRTQSLCNSGASNVPSLNTASHKKPSEPQKKRRAPGPPVAKRPDTVYLPCDNTYVTEDLDKQLHSPPGFSDTGSSQKEYHVTVYGLIPTYPHAGEMEHVPEHESCHRVTEEGQVPDIGALQMGGEEDEVFLHKSSSHTTEDLFTIIHRSKRKLLGRKDSFDNKQGDLGTQTIGGVSKTSSQNDNFMALLRRTRSAKAGSGSRISATELLRSSKPTASGAAELTGYKNHYMMQSHGP